MKSRFPDAALADENGLLCIGGDLSVETLLDSYSHGIFPWPQEGYPLLWFSPAQRGVLDFSETHWPRRLLREMRTHPPRLTFNRAFEQVIRECAKVPRPTPHGLAAGTWILPEMVESYIDLHRVGYAHSVECWSETDELIGGLYGVYIGGVFSGESMFYKVDNAGKFCLYALVERLLKFKLEWMDIQMVTDVLAVFGGKHIPRAEFQARLVAQRQRPHDIVFV